MLQYLFDLLDALDVPGAGAFKFISTRSALAAVTALLFTIFFGKRVIAKLQKRQIGEEVRDLGLEGQLAKKGTPTMGGLIIIGAIVIPTLLFAKLDNIYIILMLITTLWLGVIGFADDYLKLKKQNKDGLAGYVKIAGQVGLGLIVVSTLFFSKDVVIREYVYDSSGEAVYDISSDSKTGEQSVVQRTQDIKSAKTTIPFVKNHELDYAWFFGWAGESQKTLGWILYGAVIIFIIVAVSNGANLTDGLDGLAAGTSAISGVTIGVFAYLSGNFIYAGYLDIMYIPHIGELSIFMGAFIGATFGFLWYNSFPAQVFMGDTGSLTLGGVLAVFAVIVRKELLIPLVCFIFLLENLSVVIQVSYYKYSRKRYGEPRRVFLMTPLHHHYQKKQIPESKIVARFWIIGIIFGVLAIASLKMR